MRRILLSFVALLVATGTAAAATALVTRDLNLRPSPSTQYAPITVLPAGAVVEVDGCVRSYRWCRVHWRGHDGWAAVSYLAARSARHDYYGDYAAGTGIPVIAGIIIGAHRFDRWDRPRYRDHEPRWRDRPRLRKPPRHAEPPRADRPRLRKPPRYAKPPRQGRPPRYGEVPGWRAPGHPNFPDYVPGGYYRDYYTDGRTPHWNKNGASGEN